MEIATGEQVDGELDIYEVMGNGLSGKLERKLVRYRELRMKKR